MVYTIEEILEESRRKANGVTFEEGLKLTSELIDFTISELI